VTFLEKKNGRDIPGRFSYPRSLSY